MLWKTKKGISCLFVFFFLSRSFSLSSATPYQASSETSLLKLLNITPSPESFDYIQNRAQFFQDQLTTESQHPKTLNFSQKILEDIQSGFRQILSVEEDIEKKLTELAQAPELLENLVGALEKAILGGNRIYIYGSGASGRLALQMESTFWRPFWERVTNAGKLSDKIDFLKVAPIEGRLVGEMTGGDRALLGSMDSLEDLMLMGWLQLQERSIERSDVVICVAEDGETPAAIGALQGILDLWKNGQSFQSREARQKLFFIYNNPEKQLLHFDRCRNILEEPGITKVNLTTGPQSLTGSTRLQASTINTLVLGHVLQAALFRSLQRFLSKKEMAKIGFSEEFALPETLTEYSSVLKEIRGLLPLLSEFTRLETQVHIEGGFTTYFSQLGFFSVLNDLSGRILDFHLPPFDSVEAPYRMSKIQLWTGAAGSEEAWKVLLGRPFRGLNPSRYLKPIGDVVADPYLKQKALESLKNSGPDQSSNYDFSLTARNLTHFGPSSGDLGVCVLVSPEEPGPGKITSDMMSFMRLFSAEKRRLAVLWITDKPERDIDKTIQSALKSAAASADVILPVRIDGHNDPLGVNRQVALKVILNSHSSAVMAGLGKITGNYLTHVSPANFKLLGRATHVLQSLVNDTLNNPKWVERYGINKTITFGEANAVLFSSRQYLLNKKPLPQQTAEVSLAVIQILESLRSKKGLNQEEALAISEKKGLNRYLIELLN
jgi:N-acetylmuramic acid 6-phosphate etherase